MRTIKSFCSPLLLIVALALFISSFTTLSAARQSDDPPATPTTIQDATLAAFVEEDLGDATRAIADDPVAAVDNALADFARHGAAVPSVATLAESGVFTIPQPVGPVYLPLVVAALSSSPGNQPGPTPQPEPPPPAKITAVIWPQPSIRVARGATIAYEIRIYNDGRGDAGRTTVTLPYNRNQIVPTSSKLDRNAGDWVSELTTSKLTVTFGNLGNGKTRSGIIYFQVHGALADNTVIDMRPSFEWSDDRSGGSGRSNWAPLLVGGGNDTAAYLWMVVDPAAGAATTTRTFFTDRFVPGEPVVTWLNTPRGVKELDVGGTADPSGRVWLTYRPSDLAPGTYQLVAYGTRSRLTGVVSFTVR